MLQKAGNVIENNDVNERKINSGAVTTVAGDRESDSVSLNEKMRQDRYMNTDGTVSSSMKERERQEQLKEEDKKSFVINKGSLNITEKFVEEIMDYTIDEPYFMDTIEDMIIDDEISIGYIMRKYNISEDRSKKIMDKLSMLNIISMKDYYSAIVTITKEEWNKIEEIFDAITE